MRSSLKPINLENDFKEQAQDQPERVRESIAASNSHQAHISPKIPGKIWNTKLQDYVIPGTLNKNIAKLTYQNSKSKKNNMSKCSFKSY